MVLLSFISPIIFAIVGINMIAMYICLHILIRKYGFQVIDSVLYFPFYLMFFLFFLQQFFITAFIFNNNIQGSFIILVAIILIDLSIIVIILIFFCCFNETNKELQTKKR